MPPAADQQAVGDEQLGVRIVVGSVMTSVVDVDRSGLGEQPGHSIACFWVSVIEETSTILASSFSNSPSAALNGPRIFGSQLSSYTDRVDPIRIPLIGCTALR